MCFDHDSRPPITPIAGAAVEHRDLVLEADDGNRFAAFAALAEGGGPRPGMLVLPDVRGLHRYYEELALRFAEAGIDALALDFFGRTAGASKREEGFPYQEHTGRTTWDGLRADLRAGAEWLRSERDVRGLFSVGFCFGGRLAFLTATVPELAMSGVIGFYGWPVGARTNDTPAPADVADRMRAPVLGIFGGADQGITEEARATFRSALEAAGVDHDLVIYPDAPHSFFDRKAADFAADSADAWERVLAFVRSHSPEAEAAGAA